MPLKKVLESVVVVRDGKRHVPPIGKNFEFTDAEIADIERVRPKRAIGKPDGSAEIATLDEATESVVKPKAETDADPDAGKKAPAKGAKTNAKDDDL